MLKTKSFDISESFSIRLKLNSLTISAAAVGVGALRSDTKSAIVKSISWPTPEIMGTSKLNISLAKSSLLKHHKSSIEPPHLHKRTQSICLKSYCYNFVFFLRLQ